MPTYIEYVHAQPHDDEILFSLSKALDFTADDVVANRSHSLSARQRSRLLREELLVPLSLLAGALLFSLLIRLTWEGAVEHKNVFAYLGSILFQLGTFQFGNFSDLYFRSHGEPLPFIVVAFVGGSPMLILRKLLRIDRPKVFAAIAGKVSTEIGVVNTKSEVPETGGKDRVEIDYFVVNNRKLRVTSTAMNALTHGYHYRVYYLPVKNTLLSMEPIPRT